MGKKRKKLTAEERAEWMLRSERTQRMLVERIAFHEAKLAAERRAAG